MNQSIDWEICQYPKNQIRKATKQLIQNNIDLAQKIEAYRILAKFRSAHAYPIQSMIGYFRSKALAVDKKAVIARRLKGIPSILSKLVKGKFMCKTTARNFYSMFMKTTGVWKLNWLKTKIKM